jgi:hypothetical protein
MHAAMLRRVKRLETIMAKRSSQAHPVLARLAANPAELMAAADMIPDAWQQQLLRSQASRMLLLCSRQAGKSTLASALALQMALLEPHSLVLLLSPSLRQSGELFRKVVDLFDRLRRPVNVVAESALRLELTNGSRVVSLPGDEGTIRGYSGVDMLIIDEAARVTDALYFAVRPMLAVSEGKLVAVSTPYGQRGWFHAEWSGTGHWERVKVAATDCPRIKPEFLAEEKQALGERWFRQEYLCSFEATMDAVFAPEDIQAMLSDDVEPLNFDEQGRSSPTLPAASSAV